MSLYIINCKKKIKILNIIRKKETLMYGFLVKNFKS